MLPDEVIDGGKCGIVLARKLDFVNRIKMLIDYRWIIVTY